MLGFVRTSESGRDDAIQLSCAAWVRVDLFLTNNPRLAGKIVLGIQFIGDLSVNIL